MTEQAFESATIEAAVEAAAEPAVEAAVEAAVEPEAEGVVLALDGPTPAERAVERAREALAEVAALDAEGLSDDEAMGLAKGLEACRWRLDAATARVAGELDVRAATDIAHGLRTSRWLARDTHAHPGDAHRAVRLGRALREMPELADALEAGKLGSHHARFIVSVSNPRIINSLDRAVPALIEGIEGATFTKWCREVAEIARLLDVDGPEPDDDTGHPDELTIATLGGDTHLKARLTGAAGAALREQLEARADQLFHTARRDAQAAPDDLPVPPRRVLLARALAELVGDGHSIDRTTTPGPTTDLTLVVNAPDLLRAETPYGTILPRNDTERLLCDPAITALRFDERGNPLNMGRTTRFATPTQRRALAHRDGGCAFPGCDTPATWTDAHHIVHWLDGGETDLHNLVLLCRHHHNVTHRNGWTMHATVDQWFWWQTPTGHTFWAQRHGRQRAGPAPPATAPASCRTSV